jgi:hypothetical protein
MGSVMRKAITNIYDIPEDIIVDAIRRGLSIVRGGDPPCYLEVDVGEGLYLNDRTGGKVTVNAGDGLGFNGNELEVLIGKGLTFQNEQQEVQILKHGHSHDHNNDHEGHNDHEQRKEIQIGLGKGLIFDDNNDIAVNPVGGLCCCDAGTLNVKTGIGLSIGEDKSVNVNVGPGLLANSENKIIVDVSEDPTKATNFTSVKNTTLSMNGSKLVLTKIITTYSVKRNASGIVLDIVTIDEHAEQDEIMLIDSTYGGYGGYGHGLITSERKGSQDLPNFYKK